MSKFYNVLIFSVQKTEERHQGSFISYKNDYKKYKKLSESSSADSKIHYDAPNEIQSPIKQSEKEKLPEEVISNTYDTKVLKNTIKYLQPKVANDELLSGSYKVKIEDLADIKLKNLLRSQEKETMEAKPSPFNFKVLQNILEEVETYNTIFVEFKESYEKLKHLSNLEEKIRQKTNKKLDLLNSPQETYKFPSKYAYYIDKLKSSYRTFTKNAEQLKKIDKNNEKQAFNQDQIIKQFESIKKDFDSKKKEDNSNTNDPIIAKKITIDANFVEDTDNYLRDFDAKTPDNNKQNFIDSLFTDKDTKKNIKIKINHNIRKNTIKNIIVNKKDLINDIEKQNEVFLLEPDYAKNKAVVNQQTKQHKKMKISSEKLLEGESSEEFQDSKNSINVQFKKRQIPIKVITKAMRVKLLSKQR